MVRLCSMVLQCGELLGHRSEACVDDLDENCHNKLPHGNAATQREAGEHTVVPVPAKKHRANQDDEHNASQNDDTSADHVLPHSLLPWIVWLHLGSHRIDARLTIVLGPAWLQV